MKNYDSEYYKKKYKISFEDIETAYVKDGKTLEEMRDIIGVKSVITVSKILRAYGFETNKNNLTASQTKKQMNDADFKKYLYEEYVTKGKSADAIAQGLNVSSSVVLKYLKKYEIPRRSRNTRSSCFQGGRNICSNGYVEIIIPGHPSTNTRGYVYEHRVVAEKRLGRYLRTDEVVHHIDGNKTNNAPENLIVLSNEQHATLHSLLKIGLTYEKAIKKVLK